MGDPMSEAVQRYIQGYHDMLESADGDWVRHSDYVALEAKCGALRFEMDGMEIRRKKDNEHLIAERDSALRRAEAAEKECAEQARLNGMGSEREARLEARVKEAEQARERADELLRSCLPHIRHDKSCPCSGCDGLRQLNNRISDHFSTRPKDDGHE